MVLLSTSKWMVPRLSRPSLTLSLGSAYYFPVIRAISGSVICCWAIRAASVSYQHELSQEMSSIAVQYGQSQVLSCITGQLPISGDAICYRARGLFLARLLVTV